jgi:hypothetical protein
MKFLLRSLLVLAIAIASGLALYYAVQALPTVSAGPTGIRLEPQRAGNATENPTPRLERPKGDRDGIHWRSLLGVAGKTVIFSILVFISVIAERIIFRKIPVPKKKND